MQKILVGIDEEHASQVAVDWVIDRVTRIPSRVVLFTAFDMIASDPVADDNVLLRTRARIEEAVPGTVVTTDLADRSILEGLVERSADADLLVIGSHPHRRVRSILTGALPASIVTRSHCPVIVVPDDWEPGGSRIVLGVADDDSSDAATGFAADEARASGLNLDAVHAWRLPVPSMDAVSSLIIGPEELDAIHTELLTRVTERLGADAGDAVIRGILRHGDGGAELDQVLDDAALLVLGTHRHSPAVGAILGSVVQHMLHRGLVPVAVVGNPEKESESGRRRTRVRTRA